MKVYLVWDKKSGEGVAFNAKKDAEDTATGEQTQWGTSVLGEAFRDAYAENGETFPVLELDIET